MSPGPVSDSSRGPPGRPVPWSADLWAAGPWRVDPVSLSEVLDRDGVRVADCGVSDRSDAQRRHHALLIAGLKNGLAGPVLPMEAAPRDGSAILAFGLHATDNPPGAWQGVKAGDHWWSVLVWDVWRPPPEGQRWVFSKGGEPPWGEPLCFCRMKLPEGVL